jgi:hypothetical protein
MVKPHKSHSRGGRPRIPPDEKRIYRVNIFFNSAEKNILAAKLNNLNCSLSQYARDCMLLREFQPPLPEIDCKLYQQLAGIAQNLNQLTHEVHKGRTIVDENILRQNLEITRKVYAVLTQQERTA